MTEFTIRSCAPRSDAELEQAFELQARFDDVWPAFAEHLSFEPEDDPTFWRAAICSIVGEVSVVYQQQRPKEPVGLILGRCRHWLRPHQTRSVLAGGFAWPFGYGQGKGYGRYGEPEIEELGRWLRSDGCGSWEAVESIKGRRPLVLRIALPARTRRHEQAAVHSIWKPGTPANPREKALQLYFFRRFERGWLRVADSIEEP